MINELKTVISEEKIKYNVSMKEYTSFKTGGNASVIVFPTTLEEIKNVVKFFYDAKIQFNILGNGSNLLVSDKGYRGLVISIGKDMAQVTVEGNLVTAQAGAMLGSVAQTAAKNSLGGMEFASGIPGSIGGAIVMNAGAYDGEMKNIVKEVRVLTKEGDAITLSNGELEFGYRMSRVKKEGLIVLSVTLLLEKKEQSAIYEKMNDFSARRREKQPLEFPSAGSTFKRPVGMFAGKLIMDAGLRGYTVGGAQVSEKHCGFVINKGNATAEDIRTLIYDVQKKVNEQFGVVLEPEVIFVGDF